MGVQISAGTEGATRLPRISAHSAQKKAFVRRLASAAETAKTSKYMISEVKSGQSHVFIQRTRGTDVHLSVSVARDWLEGSPRQYDVHATYYTKNNKLTRTKSFVMPARGDLYPHLVGIMKTLDALESTS